MARGISPETNGGANLGSSTQRWGNLFANEIDKGAQIPGAFNKKETFVISGSFTAPVSGVYRITLQGGGGGGAGSGTRSGLSFAGGGGSQGGYLVFYETLTAGTVYSYTVGAGGYGGAAGSSSDDGGSGGPGGDTRITVGANTYSGNGGGGAPSPGQYAGQAGDSGTATINGSIVGKGIGGCGGMPILSPMSAICGGNGGAGGGGSATGSDGYAGGGGAGGGLTGTSTFYKGSDGGSGYITFEYYDPTL